MAYSEEQLALRTAALAIGQNFSVGGASWSYYAPSSADNITAAAALTLTGTRTLYVVEAKMLEYATSAPGALVGASPWRVIAALGTSIAAGGVVKSASDTSLCYQLGPLDDDQGYLTGLAEPAAAP